MTALLIGLAVVVALVFVLQWRAGCGTKAFA
jgi:hypothetical protein